MSFKAYVFKSCGEREGGDLSAIVHWSSTEPKKSSPSGKPIALVLHGGGFVVGGKAMVPAAQIAALTGLGFVVVIPNYRLCPQISVYDGPVTDSKDALVWCREKLPSLLSKEGVVVDGKRVAALGHSAGGGLALILGSVPQPVNAILDFYGGKYLSDPIWRQPNAYFEKAPSFPDEYTVKVFDGPQVSAAPLFTPKPGAPPSGPPPPRNAWLITTFKDGTWLDKVVQDGNYDRVDGAKGFGPGFPPTMFVHGTADTATDFKVSVRAFEELKSHGVHTELLAPSKQHMFDVALEADDPAFKEFVLKGFEFLAEHV